MTQNEALATANKLHEVKILTKKGRDLLLGYIQEDDLNFTPWNFPKNHHSYQIGILAFLKEAFAVDFNYRTLSKEKRRFLESKTYKQQLERLDISNDPSLSPKEVIERQREFMQQHFESILKYTKEFEQQRNSYEAYQIEAKIPNEDKRSKNVAYYVSGPAILNTRRWIKTTAVIHPQRSVTGKTITRTWNDLLELQLVDQVLYEDVLKSIQEQSIYSEFLLLRECIHRAYHYFSEERSK